MTPSEPLLEDQILKGERGGLASEIKMNLEETKRQRQKPPCQPKEEQIFLSHV